MSTLCWLTPELEDQILAAIRAGGFPHVAAAAFGVPPRVFERWLRWGSKRKSSVYKSFAQKVSQAHATARLNAEINTHQKDPRLWLRAGPGKETPSALGWTTFVRPQGRAAKDIDLFAEPVFLRFLANLRAVLAPYPEALQALAKALELKGRASGT
jgi:hypothetical protein